MQLCGMCDAERAPVSLDTHVWIYSLYSLSLIDVHLKNVSDGPLTFTSEGLMPLFLIFYFIFYFDLTPPTMVMPFSKRSDWSEGGDILPGDLNLEYNLLQARLVVQHRLLWRSIPIRCEPLPENPVNSEVSSTSPNPASSYRPQVSLRCCEWWKIENLQWQDYYSHNTFHCTFLPSIMSQQILKSILELSLWYEIIIWS